MTIFLLDQQDIRFPSPRLADRTGILAVGGDLSPERLLLAYQMGIFPWYSPGDPLLWWSPDPRLVIFPDHFHISRRLRRLMNKNIFTVTMDMAFSDVIQLCATIHEDMDGGTWISDEMITAYCQLHQAGWAHSVETWLDDKLVGGLYGVSVGKSFFGESMFSKVSNASKIALTCLVDHLKNLSFDLIDCQVTTPHLQQLGAVEISRNNFLTTLATSVQSPGPTGKWAFSTPMETMAAGPHLFGPAHT